MYIHQITVFLENMKGTLSKLTSLLADNGIDILAMTIADTSGFGLVRFIVRESDNDQSVRDRRGELHEEMHQKSF